LEFDKKKLYNEKEHALNQSCEMQRGILNNFADLVQSFCALHKDELLGLIRKANNRAS
jgi:hypothetical protein